MASHWRRLIMVGRRPIGGVLMSAVLGLVLVASACTMSASPSAPSSPSAGPAASGDFAGVIDVGGHLIRVPNTTHYIQLQRPDVVIQTTASVIAQGR